MAVSEYDISILNVVLQTAELRIGCSICTTKEEEITYSIKTIPHKCQENLLLAKLKKDGKCWRPISKRPEYPNPMQYDVCWFFAEGSGCTVHRKRCTFARSPEEVLIWNFLKRHFLDLESLISLISELEQNVSNLEGVSENIFADWSGEFQELCRECFNGSPCRITERESSHVCGTVLGHRWTPMMVHCLEQTPGNRMFSEIRPLPPKALLQLCCHDTKDKSPGHSPLECQFAHNKVELAVWKQEINSEWNRMELLWLSQKRRQPQHSNEVRLLSQNTTTKLHTSNDSTGVSARGPMEYETSYQDRLLKEYRDSDKTVVIMAEHVDEVDITHDEDLYLECQEVGTEIKWTFQIKTERLLSHVALLKNEPGAIFNLGDSSHNMACTYSVGNAFVKSGLCYEVTVTFKSSLSGLFEQWLVLDFDIRPVLLQKLKVRVWQSLLEPEGVLETFAPILERWHKENRVIMPYLPHLPSRTQDELLKTYDLPQKKHGASKTADSITTISRQNYRERMHHFLFEEEHVEAEMVSRLDFRGTMTLSNNLTSPYEEIGFCALPGELFGTLAFSFNITQGAPEGFLLKREVESVLVGEVTSCDPKQKVYEAVIIRDVASDKEIHLQLSRICCSDLGLQKDQVRDMEVQFQLNRLSFCEMHKAIDLLPDLNNVLPDFTNSCVPSHSPKYPKLNANQQAAMEFILGELDGKNGVAPLLIYGPFGTGKTFTLASAAKEVVCQSSGRVLICTHTNSSADIYVSRHFHQYFEAGYHEVRPLRIKTTKKRIAVRATDAITLMYCLLSPNGQLFIFPMKHDLDSHRIVIITTSWAKNLRELKLPENYFSHIMIDEASQMLESEALMALGLAGPKTRIVLAGDHMQMGPKLFSVGDDKRSDHTLLNRLFYYYQSEKKNVALESRIIFNENYRSNKEIVNFVSTHFYTGKKDTIRACGNVPAHPKHYPLRFHHVRGEWHLHPKSQSWYNLEEAETVVNIVGELLDDWPLKEWGPQKAEDICVLSEGHQVQVVRDKLRRKRLGGVLVQNLANVQDSEPIPKWHILKQMEGQIPKSLPELNDSQQSAVVHAVNNKFTLIQGPPGTGKTVVGAYIAYLFCKRLAEVDPEDKKEVVLYCGPSHKSVDVVAEYLLKFEDGLKPLRVYSKQIEMQEFPYPGSTLQLSRKSRQEKSNPQLRSITMHYRFRDNENPYSEEIKAFDEKIKTLQMSEPLTEAEEKEIENYKEVLNKAREYELKRHDVILCTCTAASSASLTKFISAKMILIDECAMATEPQALVPLVSYNPQKIVLLGDHKQLRPIVTNERAKKMGMSRSLFERCITYHAYKKAACTLNTQYRMHEEICKFPSSAYYNDKLITASSCKASVLQIQRHGMTRSTRIVFVDIKGEEISQFVSTKKGNEKSVTNREESIDATKIAGLLVNKGGVNQEDIAILSPYNAQVSDIKRRLNKKKLTQITVCTITKSQGSEWRYVILSVVRSCPIQEENTREFRSKHIGFVGDANQINVGITRAQDGLCILGNQELLTCSKAWKKLLKFYTEKNCVVTAEDIDVRA
ncbi:helicase with zinc finger domain 2-like isoform X8 [Alosa sapidissima]|uniref:helicase with zinc finger domain 2-like isoform X8 n=1 Tax=Alosa sapidissima TaxID=34773 RepID=UPI001C0A0327|nr:helicase with zinc finger domain 2-like isoform X8 [Alosa sapidissima]